MSSLGLPSGCLTSAIASTGGAWVRLSPRDSEAATVVMLSALCSWVSVLCEPSVLMK